MALFDFFKKRKEKERFEKKRRKKETAKNLLKKSWQSKKKLLIPMRLLEHWRLPIRRKRLSGTRTIPLSLR